MGDLKRAAGRGFRHLKNSVSHGLSTDSLNPFSRDFKYIKERAGNLAGSMKEGSLQIAEKLGYEKAGVTPKSDKTKQQLASMVEPIIPMADEEELRRARRRRIAAQPRAGRASTILSGEDDSLG